ncbi:MAG: VanZ family protein [Leptolyngbyaceae cyanobacterium RU_5_1]|nr:VanZ family protein [Leptolyngbyaceae cyanobacterium RU_5_1]
MAIDELATQWAPKIILLGIVLVVVSTLYPFKPSFEDGLLIQEILAGLKRGTSKVDILANIVLFTPLGFGLASLLVKRQRPILFKLIAVLLICAGLSFTVEVLQIFLSGRKPTPFDVVSNTLGGGVGYGIFQFGGAVVYGFMGAIAQKLQHLIARFSLKQLMIGLIGYAVLASLLVVFWQGSSLSSWDVNSPLSLGNNGVTGNIWYASAKNLPWEGSISDLVMSDRALSKSEAKRFFANPNSFIQGNNSRLAAYSLTGENGTRDQTGQSPSLSWQGTPPAATSKVGASLSAERWLVTPEPVTLINERIQKTSQFTLSAAIATTNTTTPTRTFERIISISPSESGLSNLTLAQTQSNLSLWLQTSRRKTDQRIYQQIVANAFPDTAIHRFVITYSGFVLRVYIDNSEHLFIADLTPNRYQIILYALILVPLGFLIGLIANRLRRYLPVYLALLGGGTVLPSLMLEFFFANEGDRKIRVANLLLGMLIVGGTLLAVRGRSMQVRHGISTAMR